jgi:hypothetical protein
VVAIPAFDRGVSTGYPKSPELAALGLDGRAAQLGACFSLDDDSFRSYRVGDAASSSRWPPCPDVSFKGRQPATTARPLDAPGWQGWVQLQAQAWQRPTTLLDRNLVSERIGEKAMHVEATALGYRRLLAPGAASNAPQGFDAVYLAPDGTYVIAEAKGDYDGQSLDDMLGYGYRCRQGTIEWARRAAERILTSGTTNSQEQQIAQQVRNRIMTRAPGFGVCVEVFHTEHDNGSPA